MSQLSTTKGSVISFSKSDLVLAFQSLMSKEFIVHTDFIGDDFQPLLAEVKSLTATEESIQAILEQADKDAKAYAKKHIEKKVKAEVN